MALLLNARLHGSGMFLYIFLLPLAISDLAAGIAWSAIFTELGYLNTILEGIGVIDVPFIFLDPTSKTQLVIAVAAAEIWRSTTFMMVILFAGLQGIPRDYVEAAEVFGAGFFQRVRHVIMPMLKPSIQVALLLRADLRVRGLRRRHRPDRGGCHGARGRGVPLAGDQHGRARRRGVLRRHPRSVAHRRRSRARSSCGRRGSGGCADAATRVSGSAACSPTCVAIVLSAWIIFPIYLITIAAFSSFDAIYVYPRQLLPSDVSTDTIRLFLESDGIIDSLKRSVYVAAITIVACLAIGTPAGYALARFSFRGANPFQLALVSTRAFPIIIIAVPLAVTYLRIGIDDTVWGLALAHVALHAPAHGAHHGERVRRHLVRAGGGGDDARLQPAVRVRRVALPLALPGVAARRSSSS